MSSELFRKEVLEARKTSWLGSISLSQPMSLWLLTAAAFLAAIIIVLFITFGEYARRTRVIGQLVPTNGIASVNASLAGTLTDVRVHEGQKVLAGEVLAVIGVPRATLSGGDTVRALQETIEQRRTGMIDSYSSQRSQLQAQHTGLASQLAAARAELDQIEMELSTRRKQQGLAEESLARFRILREKQFVTELQVQQQQAAVLEQLSQAQSLVRQALGSRRVIAQLEQARHELPAQIANIKAAEKRDTASFSQESVEMATRGQAVIQAPIAGTVSTLVSHTGQTLQPGQIILSLLPASSNLEAQLLVPSRAVGFIEPGDTVLLRYQAYPYQKFGHYRGKVERVSRSALSSGELGSLIGNAEAGEPYYRVVVTLEKQSVRAFGNDEILKPGLLLEADILGERRKLWEWVLEPLYSLTGNLSGAN